MSAAYPVLAAALATTDVDRVSAVCDVSPDVVRDVVDGLLWPTPALRARVAALLDIDERQLFELHPEVARLVGMAVTQGLPRKVQDVDALRRIEALRTST